MTRSPFAVTVIALVPLVALAWPLAQVINQPAYVATVVEETTTGPLVTADLFVRSAHPFEKVSVTVGDANWAFAPDDEVKEIHYPRDSKLILTVSVTWPADTPETAILLSLQPEGESEITQTLWGLGEVTAEIPFTSSPASAE